MLLTRLLRFALVAALPAAMIACSAQTDNERPIIDSVNAPLRVSEQNGAYAIPVTLLFHDNDGEAITRLHYKLPPNVDATMDVPAPNPNSQSTQVTIVIPVAALDGTPDDTALNAKHDDGKTVGSKKDDSDVAHQPRTHLGTYGLQISVVDGRGAESVVFPSSVTLD
jgi:hypothetical protein